MTSDPPRAYPRPAPARRAMRTLAAATRRPASARQTARAGWAQSQGGWAVTGRRMGIHQTIHHQTVEKQAKIQHWYRNDSSNTSPTLDSGF